MDLRVSNYWQHVGEWFKWGSYTSGVIKAQKSSVHSFQNFGQEGQKEESRGEKREKGEEDPVVSEEHQVILRIWITSQRKYPDIGPGQRVKDTTSSKIGGRCGRTEADHVEIREVAGELEAVWSHALCFLWKVEFKVKIRSQREGHAEAGGGAESGYGTVSLALERLPKGEVSEGPVSWKESAMLNAYIESMKDILLCF